MTTSQPRPVPGTSNFAALVAVVAAAVTFGIGLLAGKLADHLAGLSGTAAVATAYGAGAVLGGWSAAASAHRRVRLARRRREAARLAG